MRVYIKDNEYVQEEIKLLWRKALKSRHIDEMRAIGELIGAEIMLYWLMEEPDELARFLKVTEYARGKVKL